jgi:ketosteroid isomerase-like protein
MRSTEDTVRALYRGFLAGDKDAMLAEMDDEVQLRFLGARMLNGKQEANRFLELQAGALHDVRFELTTLIVDGDHAAGIWQETATRADGTPWKNHGVDIFHVRDGRVVSLHENNDVREFYALLPAEYRAVRAAGGPSPTEATPTEATPNDVSIR